MGCTGGRPVGCGQIEAVRGQGAPSRPAQRNTRRAGLADLLERFGHALVAVWVDEQDRTRHEIEHACERSCVVRQPMFQPRCTRLAGFGHDFGCRADRDAFECAPAALRQGIEPIDLGHDIAVQPDSHSRGMIGRHEVDHGVAKGGFAGLIRLILDGISHPLEVGAKTAAVEHLPECHDHRCHRIGRRKLLREAVDRSDHETGAGPRHCPQCLHAPSHDGSGRARPVKWQAIPSRQQHGTQRTRQHPRRRVEPFGLRLAVCCENDALCRRLLGEPRDAERLADDPLELGLGGRLGTIWQGLGAGHGTLGPGLEERNQRRGSRRFPSQPPDGCGGAEIAKAVDPASRQGRRRRSLPATRNQCSVAGF